jgi:nitrogen fixation/metabolism regulation signal transduction histidine kinase
MVLNKFSLIVFIQIILIAFVGMLMLISLQQEFLRMTTAGLSLLWLGLILFLNRYINRIHRDVGRFMDALRDQDTSHYFSEKKAGSYFKQLYASFNEITRNFRLIRIEKEVENQFYRELILQSASGLIAVAEDKGIKLINGAALDMLGMEKLDHVSALRSVSPEMADILDEGHIGGHQVKLMVNGRMVQLAMKATRMKLEDTSVCMYSLLDISAEMERSEIEAWQKLIRVLHHEITNSVVPLHILSTSLYDLFHREKQQIAVGEIDDAMIDQTVRGLKTIVKRSGGLNDFMNTYNSFTSIGVPSCSGFSLDDLLKHIQSLMEDELKQANVSLHISISPPGLQLVADEKLVEQVLINLVKNSIYALEKSETPEIRLHARESENRVVLEVTDNGKGISGEIMDAIFTPFFTTRKGGSGIGLSLARQVMWMHNGSIHVRSEEGEYTTFTLMF